MTQNFDIVIRGGEIIDGTGRAAYQGDVAIRDGRIAALGDVGGKGAEEIDARGLIVTPGFVDVHTHYDGQAAWDHRLAPSSLHGVTTVVAGNCGVGFAPCKPEDRDRLVQLMEGVEDVPEIVMVEGLPWNWETFPEYMDAIGERAFDIDIATQVPHSALRVYVMGERGANREPATEDDLQQMTALVEQAVRAGALGVSTSRLITHRSADGSHIPSLDSPREELLALARGLRQAGTGVFQLVPNFMTPAAEEFAIMRDIAREAGRPLSFTLAQAPTLPDAWREYTDLLEAANAEGLTMRGQVFPRPIGMMFGLDLSFNPFSRRPSWQQLADKPLGDRVAALRDPAFRARILGEEDGEHVMPVVNMLLGQLPLMTPLADKPDYMPAKERQLAALAARAGVSIEECALDAMLEQDGQGVLYLAAGNFAENDTSAIRALMEHRHTVIGLGDGGAHYGMVCDASYPTTMLAHWARDARGEERIPLEHAVAALSGDPAQAMGFDGRGVLAAGNLADVNVIDHAGLTLHKPRVRYDLPGGGRRIMQTADGYVATIKSGTVIYRDGEATGALPGGLLRRGVAQRVMEPA